MARLFCWGTPFWLVLEGGRNKLSRLWFEGRCQVGGWVFVFSLGTPLWLVFYRDTKEKTQPLGSLKRENRGTNPKMVGGLSIESSPEKLTSKTYFSPTSFMVWELAALQRVLLANDARHDECSLLGFHVLFRFGK